MKSKYEKLLPGTSSFRSFDTHDETVDGDKGKRIVLGLEHENLFPGRTKRHGARFGASQ